VLIIRRKEGESILIGEDVEIIVAEAGTRVKLAIKAPSNVPVIRKEVRLVEQQNLDASRTATNAALMKIAGKLSASKQQATPAHGTNPRD